jgi:hypothetical protein
MDIAATSFRVHNQIDRQWQIAVASTSSPTATVQSATAPYVNNNSRNTCLYVGLFYFFLYPCFDVFLCFTSSCRILRNFSTRVTCC